MCSERAPAGSGNGQSEASRTCCQGRMLCPNRSHLSRVRECRVVVAPFSPRRVHHAARSASFSVFSDAQDLASAFLAGWSRRCASLGRLSWKDVECTASFSGQGDGLRKRGGVRGVSSTVVVGPHMPEKGKTVIISCFDQTLLTSSDGIRPAF